MKDFEESDRYDLPLTADSLVMDVGGFEGNFANIIHQKFGCRVQVFEPVLEFYGKIAERFAGNPHIEVFLYGLGGSNRRESLGVKGDQSGIFCTTANYVETIEIRDIAQVIDRVPDLLKLNCEGMEYEILERLLETGILGYITNLSVQFHRIDGESEARMKSLMDQIGKTHKLTYHTPFVWTGWKLRT